MINKPSITYISVDKCSNPSAFARIVKEIDVNEIPPKYIERVMVQYNNGKVVDLNGTELTKPIPITDGDSLEDMGDLFKKLRDIRVFVDMDKLEKDVDMQVERYLGRLC
jgi:hypothetical protein